MLYMSPSFPVSLVPSSLLSPPPVSGPLPSLTIPARHPWPRFNPPPQESGISYFSRMWHQWSAPYRLGDDPLRSAQQEYRFPTIIQLDEVGPPPPSSQKALLSPVPSSSQSYDYHSSSEEYEEVDEVDDEEEEATESYCSSDLSGLGFGTGDPERAPTMVSIPVEQTVRMSRVLAWRNSFDSAFSEDNAGMFFLCLSLHRCHLPLALARHTSLRFWFRGLGSHVSGRPVILARAITPHSVFSHNLRSPAALMSLKRKYSREVEGDEGGEVGSRPGSDAVSPPPTSFLLAQSATRLPFSHPTDHRALLSLTLPSTPRRSLDPFHI